LQPKLRKLEARWRAKTMDELFTKVEKGEMSVKEMVTVVPTLQFVPEEARGGLVERAPVETEGENVKRGNDEEEIKR
jgi:hypothetical protein